MGKRHFIIAACIIIALVILVGCVGEAKPTVSLEEQLIQRLLADEAADTTEYPETIENKALTALLSNWERYHGKIFVVSPKTTIKYKIDVENPYTMNYLSEWSSNVPDCDIFDLVEKFNEINRESRLLTVKSSITNGYYINYNNQLQKYMAELMGGYYRADINKIVINDINKYYEFTNFQENLEVSMPAFNPDTGYVLIFCDWSSRSELLAILYLLKYENNTLQEVYSEQISSGSRQWVTVEPPTQNNK